MKQLWIRCAKWAREWATTPRRWRQYKQFLDMQDVWVEQHRKLASEMGYLGCYQLEAAVKIARRCMGAEEALKRLAASLEGEPDWKREYEHEAAFSRLVGKQLAEAKDKLQALENGMTAAGLSPAEVERLALLSMAAGKLSAEAAKVVLYGWGSPSPSTGRPAYVDVERGLGRLQAMAELMAKAGDVRGGDVRAYGCRAKERIGEQATRQ